MRFNFDSLVPSKNDTSLSIEDAIAAECMMVRTIDEAEDAIRQAEEIVDAIQHLAAIQDVIERYGYTPSVESLYGQTLASYGIEVTARDIGGVIKKGISKFIELLQVIVTKVLDYAEKFIRRSQRAYTKQLAAFRDKIPAMQNEMFQSSSANRFVIFCKAIQGHFGITWDQVKDPQPQPGQIQNIRESYLYNFNRQVDKLQVPRVSTDELTVDEDYKCKLMDEKHKHEHKSKSLGDLGFKEFQSFANVDTEFKSTFQQGNTILNSLKSVDRATKNLVRGLQNNRFRSSAGPTIESQGIFVYTRIILNDIRFLQTVEQRYRRLVMECYNRAKKYAVDTTPARNQSKAPNDSTTDKQQDQNDQQEPQK